MTATWLSPVPHVLVSTNDSNSFHTIRGRQTGVPYGKHCGAFAAQRKKHIHEGIDLYVPEGTPVNSVNCGIVVAIKPFTGPQLGQDWWYDTQAVFVESEDGVIVYGEIEPRHDLYVGMHVFAGEVLGHVLRVLIHDKGRPVSMLHLELHAFGSRDVVIWDHPVPNRWVPKFMHGPLLIWDSKPRVLYDPTPFLRDTIRTYYPRNKTIKKYYP